MISIVIPLYNKEKQIAHTLQSVFNQTFQDYEIVIVNDGSTDNSVEIVKQIKDSRIRLIEQSNQGVSVARNTGIKEAKYDYVALLDADDEWKPTYLETQVDLINSFPKCSVYACGYEFKQRDTIKPLILKKMPFEGEKGILDNYFEVASCSHPPLWTSAVVVQKEAFLSIRGFPVGIKSGEDLLTWARLAVKYKIAYSLKREVYFVISSSESYDSLPSRSPEYPDKVGEQLKKLSLEYPAIKEIRRYLALWHKMRASMFLLLNDRTNTIKEVFKSSKYNPFNYRVWSYIVVLLLPMSMRMKLFRRMGNI